MAFSLYAATIPSYQQILGMAPHENYLIVLRAS